jgi:hypothetical protein
MKQLSEWGASCPCFSSDGRWLSIGIEAGHLFNTQTWEPGPSIGPQAVFSPDGKRAAVPVSAGLGLREITTGREIATLEAPNLDPIDQTLFTPDGTKLVTITFGKGLRVWDLRLIRGELKKLGLDWDWPEFAPASAEQPRAEPVEVEIHLGKDAANNSSNARVTKSDVNDAFEKTDEAARNRIRLRFSRARPLASPLDLDLPSITCPRLSQESEKNRPIE